MKDRAARRTPIGGGLQCTFRLRPSADGAGERNLSSRDAGPAVDVLAVLLLPLASLASLILLSALCELTPLSIPPYSNELAESADVDMTDSDVYVRVRVGTWYIPISAQLRMRIAQYVAQNARIMFCRFYAQNAPKNAGILCVSLARGTPLRKA